MGTINRRGFIRQSTMGAAGLAVSSMVLNCLKPSKLPNVIIIFCDDMGYGDWNRAGHPTIRTPNLAQMADEGVVMTQFYSAAAVCSPSRAALLTGRYPVRTGIAKVLFPHHDIGLPKSEKTMAELLKQKNYATACIGKWHLGHLPQYLPTRQGFDYYYGIPYSNDMDRKRANEPPIPLMCNEKIIEQPCDQDTITRRYTEETIKFIQENKDQPFFVYLAHTMPHTPLHVSDSFRNTSKRGLYGDVIEEIDWSTGQILEELKRLGLDENTLVIFTSDNGPWYSQKQHGGSAGLLRGSKGTTWEGGVREPFIACFPNLLPKGKICTEMGSTMDIFTTVLSLAGVEIPQDRPIDGKNILPVLQGKSESPHEEFYYFRNDEIFAVRSGKFKLHFKKNVAKWKYVVCDPYELYDLEVDPSEKYDIASEHIDVVERLTKVTENFRKELTERAENQDVLDKLMKRKK